MREWEFGEDSGFGAAALLTWWEPEGGAGPAVEGDAGFVCFFLQGAVFTW